MRTSALAGSPSATAIEHIRPPNDRPPNASDFGFLPLAASNAAASSRIRWIAAAGRVGRSRRATGSGATPASIARKVEWLRSALAPGVNNSAPGFIRRSSEENAARFGELGDALRGTLGLRAVVRMRVAHEPAEDALHLALRRPPVPIAEPEDIEGPVVRIEVRRDRPRGCTVTTRRCPINDGPIGPRQRIPARNTPKTRGRTFVGNFPAA